MEDAGLSGRPPWPVHEAEGFAPSPWGVPKQLGRPASNLHLRWKVFACLVTASRPSLFPAERGPFLCLRDQRLKQLEFRLMYHAVSPERR
jgi:hypothetical protein